MSSASKALPQVSYNSFHAFISSVGLVLIAFSILAVFAYMIGVISFVNVSVCWGLLFLSILFATGSVVLAYGVYSWKERAKDQFERSKARTRKQGAYADQAEQRAEQDTRKTDEEYNEMIGSVGEAEASEVDQEPDRDEQTYDQYRPRSSNEDDANRSMTNQSIDETEQS